MNALPSATAAAKHPASAIHAALVPPPPGSNPWAGFAEWTHAAEQREKDFRIRQQADLEAALAPEKELVADLRRSLGLDAAPAPRSQRAPGSAPRPVARPHL